MRNNQHLEPGLLKTYRPLAWVLVATSVFQAVSIYLRMGISNMVIHPLWIFPFGHVLILGLLYWPWAINKTGRFFVPILVMLATISSILHTYLTSLIRLNPAVNISILVEGPGNLTIPFENFEFGLVTAAWQLIPLLFIPLIMVAWQYNFKAVIGFVGIATLFDLIVFHTLLSEDQLWISIISVMSVLVARTLTFLVVGFLVSQMMAAQRRQRRQLEQANQQLLGYTMTLEQLTTTRERNRLARELHDTLAHTLSGLAVQLSAIKALWEKDEGEAHIKLDDAIQTTRNGLNETRRALKSLRTAPLEDLGLCLAVKELAKTAADRCGASLKESISEIPIEIPPNISQAFYRAAQEALENIVRHSEATKITLALDYTAPALTLQVEDNGVGFDPDQRQTETYGLLGLQERADLIGGSFEIVSQPRQGTSILFSTEIRAS